MTYKGEVIGDRLAKARKEAGYSLQQVAEYCGIQQYQTVSSWEHNNTRPSLECFFKLCELYNCELGYLLGEKGYELKTRSATDIQEETGLSDSAVENLLVAANTPPGELEENFSRIEEALESRQIGEYAKIRFIEALLENDDILEKLSVRAYKYLKYKRNYSIDHCYMIDKEKSVNYLDLAEMQEMKAKELLSELFEDINNSGRFDEWEGR